MPGQCLKKYLNIAFYRFVAIDEPGTLRQSLRQKLSGSPLFSPLRGTLLLGQEGINGFLAGPEPSLRALMEELRALPGLSGLEFKESWSSELPFNRLLIKLKREIIPMGRPEIRPHERTGARLSPGELKQWLDEGRDVLLLDTRNDFEIAHGTFAGAKSLGLGNFRQFARRYREALPQDRPVVMFCTGGIRCEKATALALEEGFKDIYQLEGGILRYFEEAGGAHYEGSCFVFDNRIAVDPTLVEQATGYEGASPWRTGETELRSVSRTDDEG